MTTPSLLTRAVNMNDEPYDVYIGRPGQGESGYFGNPFAVGVDGSIFEVQAKFESYLYGRLRADDEFLRRVLRLRGQRLGCPGPLCQRVKDRWCHGNTIAAFLNGLPASLDELFKKG